MSTEDEQPTQQPSNRFFYGWIVAFSAMLVMGIANGLTVSGLTVFDESLLAEFGWSRGTLKFRDFLFFTIVGVLGPAAGALADRYGVRRLMTGGTLLLAGGLLLYSRIGTAIEMYLIHVIFALVLLGCGMIVVVMLVSNWFVAHRGTAIGIALIGTSVGGMFFPPFSSWLIERNGWRQAFAIETLFCFGILLLVGLVIREKPADMGLEPLGAGSRSGAPAGASDGLAYKAALRTRSFWAMAFTATMTFYAVLAATAHLFLYLRGLEFDQQKASLGISLLFGVGLVGKFGFGFLADHLNQRRVFYVNVAVMWAGSVLLATMDAGLVWIAIVVFSLGWGGLYTLLHLITVDSFGLRAAGKVLGTVAVFEAVGGGLGIWITGLLYDQTGSYRVPFVVMSALIFMAFFAATQVKRQVAAADGKI